LLNILDAPRLIEGFSMIQKHSMRRHDLQDFNVTNKTNKQPSFIDRYGADGNMRTCGQALF
jgi:hypothetical protein